MPHLNQSGLVARSFQCCEDAVDTIPGKSINTLDPPFTKALQKKISDCITHKIVRGLRSSFLT